MHPFIGVVVEVKKAFGKFVSADKSLQGDVVFVLEAIGALESFGIRLSDDIAQKFAFSVTKFVIVLVLPAHGVLQGGVKLRECQVGGNSETAPDFRLDAVECDFNGVMFHETSGKLGWMGLSSGSFCPD